MAQKATRDQKIQLETISEIDSLITVLGDYPDSLLPLSIDTNPFSFLIDICKSLGIFDELMLFLVKLIQYELPLIELGVKGILLANIKEMVSCSSDPFIPKYMRKVIDSNETDHGIRFSLSDLDFNGLMNINPMAMGSEYSYLGIPRKYSIDYTLMQQFSQKVAFEKASREFNSENEVTAWVEKVTKKYQNKDNFRIDTRFYRLLYKKVPKEEGSKKTVIEIEEELIDFDEMVAQPIGNIKKITYKCYVSVIQLFKKYRVGSCIYDVRQDRDFKNSYDTYIEADSALKKINSKVKRKYKTALNEGAVAFSGIKSEIFIDVNELARAKDFNAFLWYLIHVADFSNPLEFRIGDSTDYTTKYNGETNYQRWVDKIDEELGNTLSVNYDGGEYNKKQLFKNNPLSCVKLYGKTRYSENEGEIADDTNPPADNILGSSFIIKADTDSSLNKLCIKVESNIIENGAETQDKYIQNVYTLVPATSDNISLNWYADRSKYFDFLKYYASPKKEAKNSPRDYGKEIGICNIEFDTTINDTSEYKNFNRNQLRFTILPKPLITPFSLFNSMAFYKLTFNSLGEYDPHGHFSVFTTLRRNSESGEFEPDAKEGNDKYPLYYTLATKGDKEKGIGWYLFLPQSPSDKMALTRTPNADSITEDDLMDGLYNTIPPISLYECYPNLTIYEFNYDYIMSQRLFEPKVVAGQLIQSLLNMRLGISGELALSINKNITEGTERLTEVIKNMITADTYSSSDCYDTFSNEKYDEMYRTTELKKSQGYHFEGNDRTTNIDTSKIESILQEYDNPDLTPEEQVDVLNRVFNEVTASITGATEDKETWDVKFNIISQLINDLTFTIVESILTPKILMILMVNKKLMGDDTEWQGDVLKNLMLILMGIVREIVKQIKDMILSELLDFVLGFLKPKFEELGALIFKEYVEQYREQIAALISACKFGWGSKGLDTKLDEVDYADIDPIKGENLDKEC